MVLTAPAWERANAAAGGSLFTHAGTAMKLIRLAVAVASTASAFLRASPGAAPPSLRAKKDKAADADAAPVEVNALGKGSIVEFEFNKHTCIGVVDAHMVKAKGGLRYDVVTADEKVHAGVAPKDIHFSAAPLPGDKGDKSPMKRIKDFEDVLATSAARLVDPEVLEICYELAAEEDDGKVFRVKEIAKLFDEGTSPVDLYRTFRIMTSELGRVFFKSAKGEAAAFKAKAHKAVDAAKVTLCNTHGDDYGEFCLV